MVLWYSLMEMMDGLLCHWLWCAPNSTALRAADKQQYNIWQYLKHRELEVISDLIAPASRFAMSCACAPLIIKSKVLARKVSCFCQLTSSLYIIILKCEISNIKAQSIKLQKNGNIFVMLLHHHILDKIHYFLGHVNMFNYSTLLLSELHL